MKLTCNKWLYAAVLTFAISGCATTSEKHHDLMVGKVTTSELFISNTSFSHAFDRLEASAEEIQIIEAWPDNLTVDVYFGTWCHDSQREVPKLLKLLSYNPKIRINLIALDYQKSDPLGDASSRGVKYTPTIIVMQDNIELGRIVERPKNSLILDFQALL